MEKHHLASYPKDFFLQLLAIIALYVSVGSAIALMFQIVNILFPDSIDFYYRGILETIRTSSATLVVFYPVFLACALVLRSELTRFPQKAQYKIRKWLLYFTLFIAALVIIGDLVTLTNNFFSGELTIKFILKFLIVLAIFSVVSIYIYREIHSLPRQMHIVWGISAAVIVSLIIAFALVGSPAHQRKVRLDEERVMSLQQIQWEVVSYWDQKGSLPDSLVALNDDIRGFVLPMDSDTGQSYGYRIVGDFTFELCAEFLVPTPKPLRSLKVSLDDNWVHEDGLYCFERTIDPERHGTRDFMEPKPVRLPPR